MGGVLGFCVSFWNLLTGHRGGRGLPGLPARDTEAAAGAGGFAERRVSKQVASTGEGQLLGIGGVKTGSR